MLLKPYLFSAFLSYLKIEFYGFFIPSRVDVDADLMLFCGVEETASADGDMVLANGDIADLPLCQQLHLTSRSPIGRYQHLQLVAVGSRDGVDLETLLVVSHGEPLLLFRLHDAQTSGCIEGARASFIIEPDTVGSLW